MGVKKGTSVMKWVKEEKLEIKILLASTNFYHCIIKYFFLFVQ